MTSQEKDRYIVKELGGCWHEPIGKTYTDCTLCICGKRYHAHNTQNYNFESEAGRVQLLKMIIKDDREVYFLSYLFQKYSLEDEEGLVNGDALRFLCIDFMTDDTGKFRDAVYEWLKNS